MRDDVTGGSTTTESEPVSVTFTHDELGVLLSVINEIRNNGPRAWPDIGDAILDRQFANACYKLEHPYDTAA